ncbi:MAG: MBL fold metallo-hydrolase [Bacteriovoracaceae bacterium]|nr:MBL fold metallo-hydrolase [Bacteriovoracaceae bacterium]
MQIESFYFAQPLQNWSYLLHWDQFAVVIDPHQHGPILEYLQKHQLDLLAIYNTHQHHDHISGNAGLLNIYPNAQVIFGGHAPSRFVVESGHEIVAFATPGHSAEHYVYGLYRGPKCLAMFTGDLLFHCGVGRVMPGGDIEKLFQSLEKLISITPKEAIIYPGHDYGARNLEFAAQFPFFQVAKDEDHDNERSMGCEISKNIFLWFMHKKNWETLPEDWKMSSPFDTFKKLRGLRDKF